MVLVVVLDVLVVVVGRVLAVPASEVSAGPDGATLVVVMVVVVAVVVDAQSRDGSGVAGPCLDAGVVARRDTGGGEHDERTDRGR